MNIFKKLFQFFRPNIVDMFEEPATAMQAINMIEKMPPSEVIPIMVDGIQNHRSGNVRAACIRTLLPYDLDDATIQCVIAALNDRSAVVRDAAVSFFGLRGTQGRPVISALQPLIQAIVENRQSTDGDMFEEMVARTSFLMTAAAAIKNTVGAKKLMLNVEEKPFDLSSFKEIFEQVASNDEDPIVREDAKKYLHHLFDIR
jgi:hypothetical protein